jgi:hypothetical protein
MGSGTHARGLARPRTIVLADSTLSPVGQGLCRESRNREERSPFARSPPASSKSSCNEEAAPVLFRVLRATSGFALVLATAFEPSGFAAPIADSIAAEK